MKCDEAKEHLGKEVYEYPWWLLGHLLTCSRCRQERRWWLSQMAKLRQSSAFYAPRSYQSQIMQNIYQQTSPEPSKISISHWLLVGLFVVLSIPSLYYSHGKLLGRYLDPAFQVPLYLIMGSLVCFYFCTFIAFYLEDLKQLTEKYVFSEKE